MKYNQLNLNRSSTKKRVGRGIAAGRGKTAGRGTKGQGSRKSGGVRPGFEGGQMPVYMRLPHLRGFKSRRPAAEVVYTGQLVAVKGTTIDSNALFEAGLITSPYSMIKIVSNGELTVKKVVKLPAASANAVAAIEKAGGSFTKVERLGRTKKSKTTIEKQPAKT